MRIALAQIAVGALDLPGNCQAYWHWAAQAKHRHCELIVFPELSDTGYVLDGVSKLVRPWPEYAPIEELRKLARTLGIAVAAGVCEKSPEGLFNSQVLIEANGDILGTYRKIHLFGPLGETRVFRPGESPEIAEICGFRTGLMICNDIRFPESARSLAIMGADSVIVVAAWPFPRVSHWETLLRARAIENQVYIIAVNQVGAAGGQVFCGRSMVIDPYGCVVAAGSEDREALLVCDIDRDMVVDVRSRLPGVAGRMPATYRLTPNDARQLHA